MSEELLDRDCGERYEALGRLGQGAFGEVRLGLDKTTGKTLAGFRREIRVAG
jgi:serine/threonine protein kinase